MHSSVDYFYSMLEITLSFSITSRKLLIEYNSYFAFEKTILCWIYSVRKTENRYKVFAV